MSKKLFSFLFFFSIVVNVFLIISYLLFPIIGSDSGFYLSIARELYDGKIYFQEIGSSYNPLSIITFGIPFAFDDFPNYRWHLAINIIIVICSSFVFYKILKHISHQKYFNLFGASLFIILALVLDGKYVMLEPLSVFFQLLALYLYLQYLNNIETKKIFFIGLFICLSFLSKQYGLFIALPIGLDMLFRKFYSIKNIILISLGFLTPLVIFFIYLSLNGMGVTNFIMYILGKGVDLDTGYGTGIGTSFFSYPMDILYVVLFNLYIFVIPFLLIRYFNLLNEKKRLFIFLALTSLTVLVFANYWHYYQYIFPYWLLLFMYAFNNVKKTRERTYISIVLVLSFLFLTVYSTMSFKGKELIIKNQTETAKELMSVIKPKSEVYLDGLSPTYYYLCDYKSINLKKISFAFPGYFYPKTLIDNMKSKAYILTSEKDFIKYNDFLHGCSYKKLSIRGKKYIVIQKN